MTTNYSIQCKCTIVDVSVRFIHWYFKRHEHVSFTDMTCIIYTYLTVFDTNYVKRLSSTPPNSKKLKH